MKEQGFLILKASIYSGSKRRCAAGRKYGRYGYFSDRETETLEQNGLELYSGARTAFEEQYLIYMGITKPSDYLYTYAEAYGTEVEGKQDPSPLITKIENMFSNVEKLHFGRET